MGFLPDVALHQSECKWLEILSVSALLQAVLDRDGRGILNNDVLLVRAVAAQRAVADQACDGGFV